MILSNTSGVLLVCIVYSELGVRRARGSAYMIAEDEAVRRLARVNDRGSGIRVAVCAGGRLVVFVRDPVSFAKPRDCGQVNS